MAIHMREGLVSIPEKDGQVQVGLISQLRESYWEMLHNTALFSSIYGPAGILDGFPFYCDGKHLIVIGYRVDRSLERLGERSGRVIGAILGGYSDSIQSIEFWGPVAPSGSSLPDAFCLSSRQEPSQFNCDVILPLHGLSFESIEQRRDIRRAIRNGLVVNINASKIATQEHVALFEAFLRTHPGIEIGERQYLARWPEVLRDNDSVMFEVSRDDRLAGFAILSCFGIYMATYAYGFFDNSIAGGSDLVHGAMIDYCREVGFRELDLGYSIHASLRRYKMKWGAVRFVPPPWSVCWARRSEASLPGSWPPWTCFSQADQGAGAFFAS